MKPAIVIALSLLSLVACAAPYQQAAYETHFAGASSTNQGTPGYAQLIPFENSQGVVQSRNSLPPGAE